METRAWGEPRIRKAGCGGKENRHGAMSDLVPAFRGRANRSTVNQAGEVAVKGNDAIPGLELEERTKLRTY